MALPSCCAIARLMAHRSRRGPPHDFVDSALTRRSYSRSDVMGDRPAMIGIGAKVVGHVRSVDFQMAEIAISKNLFAATCAMTAPDWTDFMAQGPLRHQRLPLTSDRIL